MEVKAIARGYYSGLLREVGDQFEVSDEVAERGATWFELTGESAKALAAIISKRKKAGAAASETEPAVVKLDDEPLPI